MSKVPSSFNIYDVIVRIFPGCMLSLWIKLLFFPNLSFSTYESINFVLFLSVGFSLGALLYVGGNLYGRFVDWLIFGGNPRKAFISSNTGRLPVIRDNTTRAVAQTIVKSHKGRADYTFGMMINYLEAHGFNGKEDRMLSLAGMSSSMAVTTGVGLLCDLINPVIGRAMMVVFSLVCIAGFTYSYVHFTRIRYSVVTRTYELVRGEEKQTRLD